MARLTDECFQSSLKQYVDTMVLWFQESSLELNISKTKELCCGGCWAPDTTGPLRQEGIRWWNRSRSLSALSSTTTCPSHIMQMGFQKKAQQRMFLLRRLKGFNVRQDLLTAVYSLHSLHQSSHSTLHPGTTSSQRKTRKNSQESSSVQPKLPSPLKPNSQTLRVTQ